MRIDFLSNHGLMGGGEVMLFQLASAAQEIGHPSMIIAPEASEVHERAVVLKLPCIGLPANGRRELITSYRTYARTSEADLLWCNGPVPSIATTNARIPRIVHLHQHPNRHQAALLRWARRRALATLVPSHNMAEAIAGSTAFPNWTDAPAAEFMRTSADPTTLRIGFIGRISSGKGLDVLADAVAELPANLGVTLMVAGDDRFVPPEESAPVLSALERISEKVELVGWTERDKFHARIDLLVVPSSRDEAFGLVAAEAMARRTPLLVTDAGALPEIVGPDHPWIVRRRNPVAIATAISEMINDSDRVHESVVRGEQRWAQLFSPMAGSQRLGEFLSELSSKPI